MGNEKQRRAYRTIQSLGIMSNLQEYNPVLCGTIPINLDVDHSDLDIILEVKDFESFERKIIDLYGLYLGFKVKRTTIRERKIIKANFRYGDFEFEFFGQDQPVHQQYAYLHMVIEEKILRNHPHLREDIIQLREQGYKTEPAFCAVLGLSGDPYEKLIEYGKNAGYIS